MLLGLSLWLSELSSWLKREGVGSLELIPSLSWFVAQDVNIC
jgi:hypothetical protein